jgi:hypothetical protein
LEAGEVAGFLLHAGPGTRADLRDKLERLCRYICQPAVSEQSLSLTPNGNVRYGRNASVGKGFSMFAMRFGWQNRARVSLKFCRS